jgi:hypothetical protein
VVTPPPRKVSRHGKKKMGDPAEILLTVLQQRSTILNSMSKDVRKVTRAVEMASAGGSADHDPILNLWVVVNESEQTEVELAPVEFTLIETNVNETDAEVTFVTDGAGMGDGEELRIEIRDLPRWLEGQTVTVELGIVVFDGEVNFTYTRCEDGVTVENRDLTTNFYEVEGTPTSIRVRIQDDGPSSCSD